MEHRRLYEIKIETLEKENESLKKELEKQELIKEGYKKKFLNGIKNIKTYENK